MNPLGTIDAHIMDDADLAGPLVFCSVFASFLLLVSDIVSSSLAAVRLTLPATVRQTTILVHLRSRLGRLGKHLCITQPHVREWYRCISNCVGTRILPSSTGAIEYDLGRRQPGVSVD